VKRYELAQIAEYLKSFEKILVAQRVDDTIVKIVFSKNETLFFDMKRADSYIFKKDSYKKAKEYAAPFDVVLKRRAENAKILDIKASKEDRILQMHLLSSSRYKSLETIVQFEFTGRNTNVIILDKEQKVIEALRHIDRSVSFREVKPGSKLLKLPSRVFKEEARLIEDINAFLYEEYQKREKKRLALQKSQKLLHIQKRVDKLQKLLDNLEKEEDLKRRSLELKTKGSLTLANIYKIKNYQKEVEVSDFEGKKILLKLPKEARSPQEAANIFFARSKKLKQKAEGVHLQRFNLEEKILFLQRLQKLINDAKSVDEIGIYMPKQAKKRDKSKSESGYETFYLEGFKIMLGKNEKGNIELLKNAKKNDIWMHLKDMPSAHIIIKTDKKNIPEEVLKFGAKLCVEFSASSKGSFLVDYTKRKNVKIIQGANVNYTDYKSLQTVKD